MYEVGQILFLILNKRQQVLPIQVNEQVVRRSLEGEEISYSVAVPASKGIKLYDLNELDGEVYESIEIARETMYDQATQAIDAITKKAVAIAESRFGHKDDILASVPIPDLKDSKIKVTLEDGTVANVIMPEISVPE